MAGIIPAGATIAAAGLAMKNPHLAENLQICTAIIKTNVDSAEVFELVILNPVTNKDPRVMKEKGDDDAEQMGGRIQRKLMGSPIWLLKLKAWVVARILEKRWEDL